MRIRLILWLVGLPVMFAFIVTMALADKKDKDHDPHGPSVYASPHGNAWGKGHGSGKPDKTPRP